jgi:hypothetical protein
VLVESHVLGGRADEHRPIAPWHHVAIRPPHDVRQRRAAPGEPQELTADWLDDFRCDIAHSDRSRPAARRGDDMARAPLLAIVGVHGQAGAVADHARHPSSGFNLHAAPQGGPGQRFCQERNRNVAVNRDPQGAFN